MGSDSVLSERTLREIYLRGFEIAVKESQPMAIMTSYNCINGVHAANCHDLCTVAAREEWGFQVLKNIFINPLSLCHPISADRSIYSLQIQASGISL